MERNNYLVRGDVKYVDASDYWQLRLIDIQEPRACDQEVRRFQTENVAIPTHDQWEAS